MGHCFVVLLGIWILLTGFPMETVEPIPLKWQPTKSIIIIIFKLFDILFDIEIK